LGYKVELRGGISMPEKKSRVTNRLKIALAILTTAGIGMLLRRRYPYMPCPSSLSFLLENPFMNRIAGAQLLLDRAGVGPGMKVLDVGCGPGRITLPAARRVGANGEVVALDIQPQMLQRVQSKLAAQDVTNVRLLLAGVGQGKSEPDAYDRALLVTVLGEIPDKVAALREIHRALKPGGIVSITEVFPDPDMQMPRVIRRLALETGFEPAPRIGSFPAFTMNLIKSASIG
jgi:ubiquinone/menaquinone biosynthesis C-methylase UbiE